MRENFFLFIFCEQAQLEYVLSTEAANAAIRKYYKDDLSDLMNCMDLGFHHLLKNVLNMRTSVIENLINSEQEDIDVMAMALGSLDSRYSKTQFCLSSQFTGRIRKSSLKAML